MENRLTDNKCDGPVGDHRLILQVEMQTGRKFGSPSKPLLLSVRSGAAVSMPGMMDTVLNLGTDGMPCSHGIIIYYLLRGG
jgi:phosphoenolpyruvate synthase/pyruvate phosphate dikinase